MVKRILLILYSLLLAVGLIYLFSSKSASEKPTTTVIEDGRREIAGRTRQPIDLQFPVRKHELTNGLTILTLEDHSAPIVTLQLWVKAGSRNEEPGKTGLAHLCEHLMFAGTAKYPQGELRRISRLKGGAANATTQLDATIYTDDITSQNLELIIEMEADRFRNLNLTEEILAIEREIVREERLLKIDNDPRGGAIEQLFKTAFEIYPYRYPMHGYLDHLDNITLDDCKRFFQTYYVPNNIVIVMVGDFETKAAVDLVARHFRGLRPAQQIPGIDLREPEQRGERRARVYSFVDQPEFLIAYHIPAVSHPDYFPLLVLRYILAEGRSSRFKRQLEVRDPVLSRLSCNPMFLAYQGLFQLWGAVHVNHTPEEGERLVYEEIEKLIKGPLPPEELDRAKRQIESWFLLSSQANFFKSNLIGSYHVLAGDYTLVNSLLERINAVSEADVIRVAKNYLHEDNRTVISLLPERNRKQKREELVMRR